jgi:hypothetical protein
MRQPLMFGIDAGRIRAGTRGDRLHALAFAVAEQADRVRGEGCPSVVVAEHLPDSFEVVLKPLLSIAFQRKFHVHHSASRGGAKQVLGHPLAQP